MTAMKIKDLYKDFLRIFQPKSLNSEPLNPEKYKSNIVVLSRICMAEIGQDVPRPSLINFLILLTRK
jgi:hypothetical protein